ncbi:MAG TPA: sugar transferase [Terracidiphilus sp.]|nr:sugar transferase [Terracidiphilus sp.]
MPTRPITSLAGAHAAIVGDLLMPRPPAPRLTRGQWRIKRLMDVAGSLGMLIFTAPVMILTAIVVSLTSSGPAIVGETRVGACGKEFCCYKFRTTRMDAASKITLIGRLLQATHIDELPQLFNVLAGEMSLIGPQPEWRHLAKLYRERFPSYELRFAAKPGIMGLAQLDCPEPTVPEMKLHYDLKYIFNYSLSMDIKILLRTILTAVWQNQIATPAVPAEDLPDSPQIKGEDLPRRRVELTQAPLA